MKKYGLLLIGTFLFTLMFCRVDADAATLSLEADKTVASMGETISVNIVIDDATGVTGCSFTLAYPETVLELDTPATATSFFPTFYDRRPGATTTELPSWESNTQTLGVLLLNGAYINPSPTTGGGGQYTGEKVLFTVNFQVIDNTYLGPFFFELQQTALCNGPAGWGTDQNNNGFYDVGDTYENVPILTTAYPIGSTQWVSGDTSEQFDVLLNAFEINPSAAFGIPGPSDTDGDGLPDTLENTKCTFYNVADTDNDSLLDGVEDANQNGEVDDGETNPCHCDSDQDGLFDGMEDKNANGVQDPGETSPDNWDTDGDHFSDSDEGLAGSEPLAIESSPCVVCVDASGNCEQCMGDFECRLFIQDGIDYAIQSGNPASIVKIMDGEYDEDVSISGPIKVVIQDGSVALDWF